MHGSIRVCFASLNVPTTLSIYVPAHIQAVVSVYSKSLPQSYTSPLWCKWHFPGESDTFSVPGWKWLSCMDESDTFLIMQRLAASSSFHDRFSSLGIDINASAQSDAVRACVYVCGDFIVSMSILYHKICISVGYTLTRWDLVCMFEETFVCIFCETRSGFLLVIWPLSIQL